MKIITPRTLIQSMIKRFKYGYGSNLREPWRSNPSVTRGDILAKLNSLDLETCPTSDVDKIIGNSSWTRPYCEECNKNVEKVAAFGIEDYERGYDLCKDCLLKAASLL